MSFKRLLGLLFPLIFTGIFAGIIAYFVWRIPEWQYPLQEYLEWVEENTGNTIQVCSVVKAQYPKEFRPEMSGIAYANSPYYQTESFISGTNKKAIYQTSLLTTTQHFDGRRPLPFPPGKVWCAFIDNGDYQNCSSVQQTNTLIIATHADIYNADAVIHELPANLTEISATWILNSVGCRQSQPSTIAP